MYQHKHTTKCSPLDKTFMMCSMGKAEEKGSFLLANNDHILLRGNNTNNFFFKYTQNNKRANMGNDLSISVYIYLYLSISVCMSLPLSVSVLCFVYYVYYIIVKFYVCIYVHTNVY